MKQYIYQSFLALGIVCGGFTLTGCDLDRLPETTLADNTFWQSETDLRGACNKLYVDLPGFSHDTRADDIIGTAANSISSGSRSPELLPPELFSRSRASAPSYPRESEL